MTVAVRAVFWVIAYVGVVVSPLVFAAWTEFTPARAIKAPALVWFGMAALVALTTSSVWRRHLRISYETWHVLHTVLALVLIVGALGHVFFVDEYVSTSGSRSSGA
jgi:predicted ferric reductase